jgi:hypothetical protein
MTAIWILVGVSVVLGVVYQMWQFDCLVKCEYEYHRDQWERDGKPDGYFWRAKESTLWSSDAAKKRLGFLWLFKTPGWTIQRPECGRWLVRMRIITLAGALVVVALLSRLMFKLLFR